MFCCLFNSSDLLRVIGEYRSNVVKIVLPIGNGEIDPMVNIGAVGIMLATGKVGIFKRERAGRRD